MAIVQIVVALFQLALVLGAPMGEYAFGGHNTGKLPTRYRVASAFSFVTLIALSGHYFAQAGVFTPVLPAEPNSWVNWLLVGFFVIGLVITVLIIT